MPLMLSFFLEGIQYTGKGKGIGFDLMKDSWEERRVLDRKIISQFYQTAS